MGCDWQIQAPPVWPEVPCQDRQQPSLLCPHYCQAGCHRTSMASCSWELQLFHPVPTRQEAWRRRWFLEETHAWKWYDDIETNAWWEWCSDDGGRHHQSHFQGLCSGRQAPLQWSHGCFPGHAELISSFRWPGHKGGRLGSWARQGCNTQKSGCPGEERAKTNPNRTWTRSSWSPRLYERVAAIRDQGRCAETLCPA